MNRSAAEPGNWTDQCCGQLEEASWPLSAFQPRCAPSPAATKKSPLPAQPSKTVANLKSELPDLAGRILDAEGKVRRFINLYVDDADIRTLDGSATALTDASVVAIVPAIAGGR